MKKIVLIFFLLPVFAKGQVITTVAGNGSGGYNGDNIQAVTAGLNGPAGVVTDASGNFYITDMLNQRVRKVNNGGIITTVAGTGVDGSDYSGLADTVALYEPSGIAIDATQNLYFSSAGHVLKLTTTGIISNVAGGGAGILATGVPADQAQLGQVYGLAVDHWGNVFFSDTYHYRVCKVDTAGIITTIAGTGTSGFSGDNGPAINAEISQPYGVAVDATGNVYIADYGNARIRVITPSGAITTIVGAGTTGNSGDGALATHAQLYSPSCVALDNYGNLYIGDDYNANVRMVNTSGIISTIAGTGVQGYSGDDGLAVLAELTTPYSIAIDPSDNVYIADYGNNRIRRIGLPTAVNNMQTGPDSYRDVNVQIFPNPATTQLTITSSEKITNVTITNLIGQTVYTHEYNTPQVLVDVSGMMSGLYFVKVNGNEVRKFVKE